MYCLTSVVTSIVYTTTNHQEQVVGQLCLCEQQKFKFSNYSNTQRPVLCGGVAVSPMFNENLFIKSNRTCWSETLERGGGT